MQRLAHHLFVRRVGSPHPSLQTLVADGLNYRTWPAIIIVRTSTEGSILGLDTLYALWKLTVSGRKEQYCSVRGVVDTCVAVMILVCVRLAPSAACCIDCSPSGWVRSTLSWVRRREKCLVSEEEGEERRSSRFG